MKDLLCGVLCGVVIAFGLVVLSVVLTEVWIQIEMNSFHGRLTKYERWNYEN